MCPSGATRIIQYKKSSFPVIRISQQWTELN